MKCPNCGYENGEKSNFCLKCGTKLVRDQVETSVDEQADRIDKAGEETYRTDTHEEVQTEQYNDIVSTSNIEKSGSRTNSIEIQNDPHKESFIAKYKNKIIIAAGSAAIVALIGGCIAWDNYRRNIPHEEKSTPTYAEYMKDKDNDEKTSEVSAETSVQSQVQTTVTEHEEEVYDNMEEQPITFNAGGATLVFTPYNEYYVGENAVMGYCTYIPKVTIPSSPDAARKIESSLEQTLSFKDLAANENGTKMSEPPVGNYFFMSERNEIINVFEENGLLFVGIDSISDMGGTMLSVSDREKTLIYSLSDGNEFELNDFVKDKTAFLNAVDSYIFDTVYDRTYINTDVESYKGYDNYTLDDSVSYDDYVNEVKRNQWYEGEWTYDGENLCVNYHYLLGIITIYKDTRFFIPKSVWSDYVDFSSETASKNTDGTLRDELGNKIMGGNTAGNYANYSGYCFDDNYMYYAGGEDGYHWQLRKNYIGGSGAVGDLLSEDMTDAVMVYGDRVYYRNATDGYKLYSISQNGTDKKALTDTKASGIRIYDGKIYFTSDGKLYRMDMDGKNKEKILDKGCYDLQIYGDRLYTASSDNSCIEVYDLLGIYQWTISSQYTTTIKWFFVSYGNCVMANENSISIIDAVYGGGPCFTDMNIKGIGEDKNNYLVVVEDAYGECVMNIAKNYTEQCRYYDYITGINNREFYIIYDDYNTYIYTFDRDGVVSSEVLGDY